MPKAQTAFMFFSADTRRALKGGTCFWVAGCYKVLWCLVFQVPPCRQGVILLPASKRHTCCTSRLHAGADSVPACTIHTTAVACTTYKLWHDLSTCLTLVPCAVLLNFLAVVFAGLTAETEPGLSMPEMGKRCGEMWRELSEEEKKPYHVSPHNTLLRPSQPPCFHDACICAHHHAGSPCPALSLNLPAQKSVHPGRRASLGQPSSRATCSMSHSHQRPSAQSADNFENLPLFCISPPSCVCPAGHGPRGQGACEPRDRCHGP